MTGVLLPANVAFHCSHHHCPRWLISPTPVPNNTLHDRDTLRDFKTAREHVAYVKSLHPDETETRPAPPATRGTKVVPAAVRAAMPSVNKIAEPAPSSDSQAEPLCPKCGASMVLRNSKRGANAGSEFWGCSNYPKCREIVNVAAAGAEQGTD